MFLEKKNLSLGMIWDCNWGFQEVQIK